MGASQLIVDGKIGLKNDSQISHFEEKTIVFEDGSTLPADVVIFATGYGDPKQLVAELAGPEVANHYGPVWGFNEEGEFRTMWQKSGHPGLWFMGGNLAISRYYSRVLALQIKAVEEGIKGI